MTGDAQKEDRSKLLDLPRTRDVGTRSRLNVRDLSIAVRLGRGALLPVVDSVTMNIGAGESVGVVGESGSGKTLLCRALIGTLDRHSAVVTGGSISLDGIDLVGASESTWRSVRGSELGYVPQSSLAVLNPILTVEKQIVESLPREHKETRRSARGKALELLEMLRVPRAKQILGARAHELSGGMRQRVVIACAIAQSPSLLIADEPTTALDVAVQSEVLSVIDGLRRELDMSVLLVSHDLAVIEQVCDSVVVMYAGASVEASELKELLRDPLHPYTRALLNSRVDLTVPGEEIRAIPGEPVTAGMWGRGCRFAPRCELVSSRCRTDPGPLLSLVKTDREVACFNWARHGDAE